jgi:hypothetical protein
VYVSKGSDFKLSGETVDIKKTDVK